MKDIHKSHYSYLILILIIGASLRFYGLRERGLILWDEAHYASWSLFGHSVIENFGFILGSINDANITHADFENRLEGSLPLGTPKPGHILIQSIFSIIFGKSDYSNFISSAFFGVLTIILVYLLLKLIFNQNWGLAGAFFLAINPVHIHYSRSAMAETDTAFFLMLSVFCFYKYTRFQEKKLLYLVSSGFTLGCFFSCNYRWIYFVPIFLCIVIIHKLLTKQRWKNILIFAASFCVIPLIFHVGYIIADRSFHVGLESGYVGIILNSYKDALNESSGIYLHSLYLNLLESLLGKAFLFVCIIGTVIGIKRIIKNIKENFTVFLIGFFVWVPLVLFSIKTRGDKLVAISIVLPFLVFLFVFGLNWIYDKIINLPVLRKRLTLIILCLFFVSVSYSQLMVAESIINLKSGHKEAVEWLKGNNSIRHLTTAGSISNYYVGGREKSVKTPMTNKERRALYLEGYRYLLMDIHKYYHGPLTPVDFYKDVETQLVPVAVFDNSAFNFYPSIVDDFHYRHFDKNFLEQVVNDEHVDKIRIYDLSQLYSE